MKTIQGNTQSAKGLTWLNMVSLLIELILFILIPALNVFAEVISTRVVYIIAIIWFAFNTLFYIVPATIKKHYFQYRIFVVYLPTLFLIGMGIWELIAIIIALNVSKVLAIIFSIVVVLPPITFSLLIRKLLDEQPTLLG